MPQTSRPARPWRTSRLGESSTTERGLIDPSDPGYKIGEAGTITPTSTYDDGKTCPDTTAPRPSGLIAPACVCNDNFSTSCNASGANTWYVQQFLCSC